MQESPDSDENPLFHAPGHPTVEQPSPGGVRYQLRCTRCGKVEQVRARSAQAAQDEFAIAGWTSDKGEIVCYPCSQTPPLLPELGNESHP